MGGNGGSAWGKRQTPAKGNDRRQQRLFYTRTRTEPLCASHTALGLPRAQHGSPQRRNPFGAFAAPRLRVGDTRHAASAPPVGAHEARRRPGASVGGRTDRRLLGLGPHACCGSYFAWKREAGAPSSSASRDGDPALLGTHLPLGARALSSLGTTLAVETGRRLGLWRVFSFLICFSARLASAFFIGHQGESRRLPLRLDSRLRMGGDAFPRARGAESPPGRARQVPWHQPCRHPAALPRHSAAVQRDAGAQRASRSSYGTKQSTGLSARLIHADKEPISRADSGNKAGCLTAIYGGRLE